MQRLEKIWAQNAAPKVPEWPSYGNFGKVTQNPHFLKKEQRGDQGKFFKNRPKSSPRLKGLKALWRKWHYPPISMHLKCKDWRRFWRKQRLQTVPEWPSHWYFRNITQNPHFLKKWKGGTKGNFSKIAQKVALVWKAQNHSGANNIILYFVCTWSANTGQDFGPKSGFKSARMAKVWQFSQGHPKPAFSEKVQTGEQGKFLKNRQKSGPRLKGLKALWC